MYNFFVESEQIENNKVIINGDDYNHISNVLRMKINDKFYVCNKDNAKSYLVQIETIEKQNVECKIISEVESTEPAAKITLFQGIPKSDKMETIIQKSVELGVTAIVPVAMKNCIGKIKDENKKIARWKSISEAAAKQSKRNIIPKIENQINDKELEERIKDYELVLMAYENEKNLNLRKVLNENKNAKNIAIIIGAEGGIDQSEAEKFEEAGAVLCSIGKRILRCETAPLVMLSMIMYEFEF